MTKKIEIADDYEGASVEYTYGEVNASNKGTYDAGFDVPLKWFRETVFTALCAFAFYTLVHYSPVDSIGVFVNAALSILFIVILLLTARLFGLGNLLARMLKAVPSVKRLK